MAATNMGWPIEHEAAIPDLIAAGKSGSEIAKAMNILFNTGYSRNAIIGKITRMGLHTRGTNGVRKNPNKPAARPRAPVKVLPPQPVVPNLVPKHASFERMTDDDGCRWPFGNGPYTFCNHKRFLSLDGEIKIYYCPTHLAMSRGNGTPSERGATRGIPGEHR